MMDIITFEDLCSAKFGFNTSVSHLKLHDSVNRKINAISHVLLYETVNNSKSMRIRNFF